MTGTKNGIEKTTIFYLARGPIIVFAVIVSLSLPYIQEYCTPNLLLHLTIASLGLLWMFRDVSTFLESAIRSGLNLVLDKIVLDNLLRTIYDPVNGIWACSVGTHLGALSMYGLGFNEAQRTELIQSSLGLRNESQAHSVLLEPGGCKALLSTDVQNWLQCSQSQRDEHGPVSSSSIPPSEDKGGCENENKSACDSDTTVDMDSQDTTFLVEELSTENDEQNRCPSSDSLNSSLEDIRIGRSSGPKTQKGKTGGTECQGQTDPLVVFFRILQRMAQTKLKSCAENLPRSKIETMGIAATAAYAIQYALRRPSPKKTHLLSYVCASIATISFGTLLSREAFLGNIYDKQSMLLFCKDLASRILNKVKEKSASNKKLLAMLVLVIFCRRKQISKGRFHQR